jgi:tetratricopeptide (TPR) repeat protein
MKWIAGLLLSLSWLSLGGLALRERWVQQERWEDVIRWNPGDAQAWEAQGRLAKDSLTAAKAFSKAVQYSPSQPYYRESLAGALEALGPSYRTEAEEHYRRAWELAPSRALNALSIGRLYYRDGKFKEALPYFESAQRIEPHYWESDLWIARCWKRLGEKRKAQFILRALQRRHNDFVLYQKRMVADLPSQAMPSGYEAEILRYDDAVVRRELHD